MMNLFLFIWKIKSMKPLKTSKIPRPASTIILVRQHQDALQVYLIRRSIDSSFFPGFYVFPGGGVDAEDRGVEKWQGHIDLTPDAVLKRFKGGMSIEDAMAFGISAIRETFEEAGVMFMEEDIGSQTLQKIHQRRLIRDLGKGWLWEWVFTESQTLSLSRLARWSHWITPELFKSHFDTRFFIARMPSHQDCCPDNHEMTDDLWITPEEGLAMNHRGDIALSPPTVVTLHELLPYTTLNALKKELYTHAWGTARRPRLVPLSEGAVILQPWDPLIDQDTQDIIKDLDLSIIPVGESFSRLWLHNGLWRPIRGC
jgi:hypothetical protein